jgi:HlyD family secretion protein
MSAPTPEQSTFSARRPILIGALSLLVLVGGFGSWAVLTSISGAIIASGRIEVDQNRQVVQHPTGGVVSEILIKEGDLVEAGASLLRLDTAALISQQTITENQLYELMARRGRLEAEINGLDEAKFDPLLVAAAAQNDAVRELMQGQSNLLRARADTIANAITQLRKRASQIDSQITGINAQRTALERQLELIRQELASQQTLLDRGLAQATRVLSLQREESRLAGTMGELDAQKAQAEGRITEIDIEILNLGTQRREEALTNQRDLQYRELELLEKRSALTDEIARMDIAAPVSGIVYGLRVSTPRSVIRPADPILFLIPQDRPLVIMAQVDIIDIDKVFIGQEVNLRFAALDQRLTPEVFGKVSQISADAFSDEVTKASYYRAEIVINPGEMSKLPDNATLLPGMPVEAFIRTADRTPIAFLVKPLTDYFAKAFRG